MAVLRRKGDPRSSPQKFAASLRATRVVFPVVVRMGDCEPVNLRLFAASDFVCEERFRIEWGKFFFMGEKVQVLAKERLKPVIFQ